MNQDSPSYQDKLMTDTLTDSKAKLFEHGTKVASYKFDPLNIAIQGGADSLPEGERGPLDTLTDKTHPLYDERLKTVKMSKEWVANLVANGVIVGVKVAKVDGIPLLVDGRERVRGARLANVIRRAAGQAPIEIRADVVTTDNVGLLRTLVATNVHFEDSATVKIAKLGRLIEAGVTTEDAAILFGVNAQTAKAWLQYDKTAIATVKKAVSQGKIPQTVGADIARLGAPDKQQKALDRVLAVATTDNPDRKVRKGQAAKAKRAIAESEGKTAGVSDKKTLRKLLALAVEAPKKGDKDTSTAWWRGVADTLSFVLGGDEADARLIKLMAALDSAPTDGKVTKAPKAEKAPPEGDNDE